MDKLLKGRIKMEKNVDWLDSDKWVLVSPQEFSRFALIKLKGVHSLIKSRDIDTICRGEKTLIPVPIANYYAVRKSEIQGVVTEVNWSKTSKNEANRKETN